MVWTFRVTIPLFKSRPANEDNSIVAKGYALQILILWISKCHFGVSVENLLNTKWNETQFATESRLKKSLIVLKKFILPWNTLFYESKNYLCLVLLNDLFVLLERSGVDINWRQVFLYWLSIKYMSIAIYIIILCWRAG
jgi:hypothetical protein